MQFAFYLILFLLIGTAPIYIVLLKYGFEKRTIIISALAFAPLLITTLNTLNVVAGIQHSWARFALPGIVLAGSVLLVKRYSLLPGILKVNSLAGAMLIGLVFGVVYWFVAFYPQKESGFLYYDIVWNLGWAAEFRNHFPIMDPHWKGDDVMVYHFLPDMFIGAMANLADTNILEAMHSTNLLCALLLFVILSLVFSDRSPLEALTVFTLALALNFASSWSVFAGFQKHMTGASASTFYWSLPAFIALVFLWSKLDQRRLTLRHGTVGSLAIFTVIVIGFSKGTFIAAFVLLEFFSFVRFIRRNHIVNLSTIKGNLSNILKFIYYPAFTVLLFLFFSSWGGTMFLGIEARDFAAFESWNIILPLVAVYMPIVLMFVLNIGSKVSYRFEYLFASVINLATLFLLKHVGNSDIYFGFSAIVLNALFLADTTAEFKLPRYLVALTITSVAIAIGVKVFHIKGLHPLRFDQAEISKPYTYGNDTNSEEIQGLMHVSNSIPENALVAVPPPVYVKNCIYSAFMERRTWNENDVYQADLFSRNYYAIYLYFKQQDFIPKDLPDTPRADFFGKALTDFMTATRFDTIEFEEQAERMAAYEESAFGSRYTFSQNDSIAIANGWSHILIKATDTARRNSWVRSLEPLESDLVHIYKCPSRSRRGSLAPEP